MNDTRYQVHWVNTNDEGDEIVSEEVITMEGPDDDDVVEEYFVGEEIISSSEMNSLPNTLQIPAENLVYMSTEGQVTTMGDLIEETVEQVENADYNEHQYFECQVTEEVITDDWVQQQGEERVEIPVDQLCGSGGDSQVVEEFDVPLPTDQDEYTALRPFPCDFCSRRFRKKISLNNHMIAHQNDRHHTCHLCGSKFLRKSELVSHLKMHVQQSHEHGFDDMGYSFINEQIETKSSQRHDYCDLDDDDIPRHRSRSSRDAKKMKYKIKEEKYLSAEALREAMVEPRNDRYPVIDQRKPFVCQQCGISFAREKALLSHSRMHDDFNLLCEQQKQTHFESSNSEYEPENDEESESENESKYGEFFCDVCGMAFHRQDLLKRHTKLHIKREFHEMDVRHCCNVCGQTFSGPLELLAHAEIHARFQPFKCMLCGETFLEEATIQKHLMNVHSGELNENSCKLCGKQCRDARTLAKHACEHSKEKDHCCMKCGKTFHNKARLKRHMVSHRNKSVTCDVCKITFPDGRSLMNHRHSHTNTSGKLFPCTECGKTFGSRSSQQIHVRIHTGERPYGCKYCWKAFADGGTLRKHERIHTGEKPYACSVCPRAFNQRVVLREHIRTHHSAPDSKRGTPTTPFYCTACSDLFATSAELIQHLIHHSDVNTARQRQPIASPRKYKRRRKLKPHELERLRTEKINPSDIDYSDLDMGNVDDLLALDKANHNKLDNPSTSMNLGGSISGRKRKDSAGSDKISSWQQKLIPSTANDDPYSSVFQNIENALQNIEPLVVNNNISNNNNNNIATTSSNNLSGTNVSSTNNAPTKSKSSSKRRSKHDTSDKPSRPKMIHTQKTRVAVEDGKRKTKTLITQTTKTAYRHSNNSVDSLKTTQKSRSHDYDIVIDGYSDYNNSVVVKSEPTSKSDLFDAQLLLEAASAHKDYDRFNDSDNDIANMLITQEKPTERSTTSTKSKASNSINICDTPEEDLRRSSRIRRSAKNRKYYDYDTSMSMSQRSSSNIKVKEEKSDVVVKTEKIEDLKLLDSSSIKNEPQEGPILPDLIVEKEKPRFRCEMCFEVFSDRSQLLVHVPIHI